jgi:hypothetical protein
MENLLHQINDSGDALSLSKIHHYLFKHLLFNLTSVAKYGVNGQ